MSSIASPICSWVIHPGRLKKFVIVTTAGLLRPSIAGNRVKRGMGMSLSLTGYWENKWVSNRRDLAGVAALLAEYKGLEASVQVPQTVNGLADLDPGFNYRLNIRGDYDELGEAVPRGAPEALTPAGDHRFSGQGSGRLELATIVASPDHPLTARVYVNRIWHWLFGKGIVADAE